LEVDVEGRLAIKVYYEDTDCLGVVYHASYLRFIERGRTEFIAQLGKSLSQWNEQGVIFAVYKLEITFRKAARFADELEVVTRFGARLSEYRIQMEQQLLRDGEPICKAQVQLVCLDADLAVRSFPEEMLRLVPERVVPVGRRRHSGRE
jgi:acyl-CoA thioester hydrolase